MPTVKNAYTEKLPLTHSLTFSQPSRTKQSFKSECDINNIMARYQTTGILEFANKHEAQYADVSSMDYQESMQKIAQANSMFNDLPSSMRARFENDPAQMLAFLQNEANREEAVSLGLVNASPSPVMVPTSAPEASQGVSGA